MTQILLRRGTAAEWTSANPTLAAGEAGFETDTGKFKIGNGSTAWTSLGYHNVLTNDLLSKLNAIEASADVTDETNVASAIAGTAEKATPVDADSLALIDSADSDALKKVLLSALKTYMQGIKLDDLTAPDDNTDLDVSTTAHGLVPKAPNDTDQFLCGDGSWSTPSSGGLPDASAGDILQAVETAAPTATTVENISYTSMTKVFEIRVCRGGTFRIKYQARNGNNDNQGTAFQIYRNGVAVGTYRDVKNGLSYTTYSEDISGWSVNDLCQLYTKKTGACSTGDCTNFKIYADSAVDYV